MSTGLKEKGEGGFSYGEMTDMLEKLVVEVDGRKIKVRPEIVVSVQYQNVQRSPTNSSGFALRFPRILRLREDRGISDIATLDEVEQEAS